MSGQQTCEPMAPLFNTGAPRTHSTSVIVRDLGDGPMLSSAAWVLAIMLTSVAASGPFIFGGDTRFSLFERLIGGLVGLVLLFFIVRPIWRRAGRRAAVSHAIFLVLVVAGTGGIFLSETELLTSTRSNQLAAQRAAAMVEFIGRDMQGQFQEKGFVTYDPVAVGMIRGALEDAETQMEGPERRAMRLLRDVVGEYNAIAETHGRMNDQLRDRLANRASAGSELAFIEQTRELCEQVLSSNGRVLASVAKLPEALQARAYRELGDRAKADEMVKGLRISAMHLTNVQMCEGRLVEAALAEQKLLASQWGAWTADESSGRISFQEPAAAEEYAEIARQRQSAELMYARAMDALFQARQHPLLTSAELVSAAGE